MRTAVRPLHDHPSLDPEALARLERFGGDKLLREMIALYLVNAPDRITAAEAALLAGDVVAAENALHSQKSSSAQLGALRLARICEAGEQLARAGRLTGVADVVLAGRDELARVDAWLTATLEARAS
jgi:HPt (histidine-containing phosphotransfer) domain-containing protein